MQTEANDFLEMQRGDRQDVREVSADLHQCLERIKAMCSDFAPNDNYQQSDDSSDSDVVCL
ncbi:hypothetical protein TVAG_132180 [Trichomonas vaginalis G3]|uniref:Uncharacterized protein n=1 Tax=Trichomonas vaginalis (strain ATCC PRA-98 / G3) TaxID=412133 RepID=A2FNK1_TRIV3|nr:hypothetical protein TVAGG3_0735810 [Trichomonas vaginalis G3]EAX93501.1 hypothetical protein TVAG_132180 [Trichomonas vaginalis G3]KAI5511574.1 hypothetical protein TVAGG3_0735810 [Trichomonas vaginalis G3]|eukprot:XP_001306431.1 hypothetical protein [Trichomonas vaginalis G3]